jgi:hypothetical protein
MDQILPLHVGATRVKGVDELRDSLSRRVRTDWETSAFYLVGERARHLIVRVPELCARARGSFRQIVPVVKAVPSARDDK